MLKSGDFISSNACPKADLGDEAVDIDNQSDEASTGAICNEAASNKDTNGTTAQAQQSDSTLRPSTLDVTSISLSPSLASMQLAAGFLQVFEPPLVRARNQLRELIGKQNKIYVDLSAEKFKLDNAEMGQLHDMMNNIKVYREKLMKIKKQMQNIYHRTNAVKKRALNIEACKQRELQRKLQKQQQEEALIGT